MANARDGKYVRGIADLSGVLNALPEDMRQTILAGAVARAIKPIEVAAKRFAKRSERTGALRASITTKVKSYPRNGKAVGLVGPDRGYYRKGKKAGKLGALFGADRPANYAHLVEFGHHVVAPIKGTSRRRKTAQPVSGKQWVPAKPFIRPALLTTTDQQGTQFYAGIAEGIEKTRKRLVKDGVHTS